MQVAHIHIQNFRGVKEASLFLSKHAVLLGDNNTGKTTVLEALDLTLGPDRLNRTPPIDEHDFYRGQYHAKNIGVAQPVVVVEAPGGPGAKGAQAEADGGSVTPKEALTISIEATIIDLTAEQQARFGDYIEFWDPNKKMLYSDAAPEGVDATHITHALRVTFLGHYDPDEDDFEGKTYYTKSIIDGSPMPFSKKDKQVCGFLYLRSVRTGSRALSLERGSLLDIILRLKEVRPQMWEAAIEKLASFSVAEDPALGISGVLKSINTALKKYVPKEWGIEPHLKVSNLTREHLRKVITAFIATGEGDHAAPFYRQGTGTINMLVLAMLSQIAEDKDSNVIFAMEEPETAIPPYAQKTIIHEIRKLASQTLFTSHSPYVLEEFALTDTIILSRNAAGKLQQTEVALPDSVKLKRYRQEFRQRFCEGLLARRVLIAEGATESDSFPVACRRLAELKPEIYSSIEALGICIVDAGGESNIPDIAKLYKDIGKQTFALCDQQDAHARALIEAEVEHLYMHGEKGIENLILKNTTQAAMERFSDLIQWPQDLLQKYEHDPKTNIVEALRDYFGKTKADLGIAEYLAQCSEDEIPKWIRDACIHLKMLCTPPAPLVPAAGAQPA
jgi:putative ATP-dependent endonuclease of the OLD family